MGVVEHEHHVDLASCLLGIINGCDLDYLSLYSERDIERVIVDVVFELLNYAHLRQEDEQRQLVNLLKERRTCFQALIEVVKTGQLVRFDQVEELLAGSMWDEKMIKMPLKPTEAEIHRAVRQWMTLLANEGYEKAWGLLGHASDEYWSVDLMQRVIESYGAPDDPPEIQYKVTDPQDSQLNFETYWMDDDETVARVEADLPLNGEQSDLTLILEVKRAGQHCEFQLSDIHVL